MATTFHALELPTTGTVPVVVARRRLPVGAA
jgi:hypothetical protein